MQQAFAITLKYTGAGVTNEMPFSPTKSRGKHRGIRENEGRVMAQQRTLEDDEDSRMKQYLIQLLSIKRMADQQQQQQQQQGCVCFEPLNISKNTIITQ